MLLMLELVLQRVEELDTSNSVRSGSHATEYNPMVVDMSHETNTNYTYIAPSL